MINLYFKKLELFGFKSFPEKTDFIFESGITAIVGPNGCGKTNIADAIRWVLGEQSALALRGSRMEDVIFNGSADRKPLGMAEVSLTMANPENFLPLEYSEVTITRRMFRSGESQYFINRTPCRLKDISELFMDTGVGTQAYSMIEQGKIDLVLSSKPDDRRYLFEEAAGITKYKTRKKTALRRLEATEQNLVRVSDIVSEVKRQINSLKRQVRKAERYKETSQELKELEIKLALSKLRQLNMELESSLEEARGIKDEREQLSAKISRGESKAEELRVKLLELEKVLNEWQWKNQEVNTKIHQSESQILLLRERGEALEKEKSRAKEELANLEEKLAQLKEDTKETETNLVRLTEENARRKEKLKSAEESLGKLSQKSEEEEAEIKDSQAMVVEIATREAKVRNDLAALKVTLENLRSRKKRLEVEKERGERERKSVEERLGKLEGELEDKKALFREIEERKKKIQSQLSTLNSQLSTLQSRLVSCRGELTGSSSRLNFLQDLKQRYEGYQAGVKAILQKRDNFPGVCGTVADAVDLPANLEAALEVALGDKAQGIIVRRTQDAEEAISYLKREGRGRAAFFPLDSIKPSEELSLDAVLKQKGVIGIAKDLIKFDPAYKNVFFHLLGRTVVIEDLTVVKQLTNVTHSSVNLVTLDGELISRSGARVGGAASKGGGLLRRDAEIRELKGTVAHLGKTISEMESESKVISEEINKFSGEINLLEEKQSTMQMEKVSLESDYSSAKATGERLDREFSIVQGELREVAEDDELTRKERDQLNKEREELSQRRQMAQERIGLLQQSVEEGGKAQEELSRELTRMKVELASWEEKEKGERSNLSRLKESQQEYIKARDGCLFQLKEAEKGRQEIDQGKEERERKLKELFEERDSLEEDIGKRVEDRKKILSEVNQLEKEVKDDRSRLDEIQARINNLDLRQAQLKMEMDSIRQRISSEYQISLPAFAGLRPALPLGCGQYCFTVEEIDEESISREIVNLKAKLEAMGPVNLAAIEESKELEERYNFLTNQQEDLLQAKESLQKVIAKINRTTRSLFMDTFTQVRGHFHELFRTLFGGGRADLVLIDEADVLESGIDIVAQPPGKKLQTISLLSGGERALTAIALLFALIKVKPSPFCLLDEIDAPLDESNIDRFIRLLREFVVGSQFIIVTHNKRTIAMADVMYGVTMEESGVSKLVSVRLTKEKG